MNKTTECLNSKLDYYDLELKGIGDSARVFTDVYLYIHVVFVKPYGGLKGDHAFNLRWCEKLKVNFVNNVCF